MSFLERFRLDGKVAVVTGASSGLGIVFASALAEAGADIVVCARRVDRLHDTRELVAAAGRRCIDVACDVSQVEDCEHVVDAAMAEFGRLDILVNNAGVTGAAAATREDPKHFRDIVAINLEGSFWMAQACGRVMKSGSSVVNIGSILASRSTELPQAAYAASKAAVHGLTRDLAHQWTGRKGIRVNALAPGYFPTDMNAEANPEMLRAIADRTPTGRLGRPDELGCALLFLASDASSYVTGTVLTVDGGLLTQS